MCHFRHVLPGINVEVSQADNKYSIIQKNFRVSACSGLVSETNVIVGTEFNNENYIIIYNLKEKKSLGELKVEGLITSIKSFKEDPNYIFLGMVKQAAGGFGGG